MQVVAGPAGSGKSSAFPLSLSGIEHFNVDDRCAALNRGSYAEIPAVIRQRAQQECEAFVEGHIEQGRSFAVETTLRTTVALEQAARARRQDFFLLMRYVALDGADTCVERVRLRALAGGHAASVSRIRQTYRASFANLPRALDSFDVVLVYDNTVAPRCVLEARRGHVTYLAQAVPQWLREALRGTGYEDLLPEPR